MKNKTNILDFNSSNEYNDIEVSKILDYFFIDNKELIKLSFKSLNTLIFNLNNNYDEYVANNIMKNINLITFVCNKEILNNNDILRYKDKIKNARESILAYANKYDSSLLFECSNKLDEIVLYKQVNVDDLIKLIKELINRKEDVDIIKKIVNINKGIITYSNDDMFDYIFNLAYDSIKNNERSIFYYITLLKIFYHSKLDIDKYINRLIELDDLNNKKADVFIMEVASLLYGNKRSLNTHDILKKYNLNDEIIDKKVVYKKKNFDSDDKIITIDDNNTILREDGLSIKKDGNKYIVGIHISDAGYVVYPNRFIDHQAKNNLKCIYLANGVRILPNNYEKELSLDEKYKRNLISLYVVLNDSGEIIDYYLKENTGLISKNYKYSYTDYIIDNTSNNELEKMIRNLFELSCALHENNSIKKDYWEKKEESKSKSNNRHNNKSDLINSEFIVLYNYLLGKITKDNNIPFIYRYQDEEYISALVKELEIELDSDTSKMIKGIYLDSKYSSIPKYHYGLGMECYAQVSDPCRKYPDLYNQYLLHRFYFNDLDFDFDMDNFNKLIEYINQRSIELKLMRSEYSRGMKLEKKIRNS